MFGYPDETLSLVFDILQEKCPGKIKGVENVVFVLRRHAVLLVLPSVLKSSTTTNIIIIDNNK